MPCQTIRWERGRRWFTWSNARGQPHGLPGGRGLNTAYEAADRHGDVGHGEAVALRSLRRDDTLTSVTCAELARRSDRFAAGLRSLSIGPGGRVCTLLGRGPDLLTVVIGTLKNTSVRCRRKGAGVWEQFPGLWHVLIVGEGAEKLPDTQSFDELMSAAPPEFTIPPTDGRTRHCRTSPGARSPPPRRRCTCTTPSSPTS
ncbi:AMP-binding protein [Streptomyces sp. SDT5-1]|uniref:AMP-binding protein n=1 Tax=Streptomyces sp. SDT5-1 TaxID=3406418 RepID=UPI003FD2E690